MKKKTPKESHKLIINLGLVLAPPPEFACLKLRRVVMKVKWCDEPKLMRLGTGKKLARMVLITSEL